MQLAHGAMLLKRCAPPTHAMGYACVRPYGPAFNRPGPSPIWSDARNGRQRGAP